MTRWFSRGADPAPEVVERIEPVEIPVITESKRRLGRGENDAALREAYLRILDDVQRAYHVTFAPGWSASEILDRGLSESMGPLPEFLRRLTALYLPMRFSPQPSAWDPAQLTALLQSIYSQRPMWALYLQPRREDADTGRANPPSNRSAGNGSENLGGRK